MSPAFTLCELTNIVLPLKVTVARTNGENTPTHLGRKHSGGFFDGGFLACESLFLFCFCGGKSGMFFFHFLSFFNIFFFFFNNTGNTPSDFRLMI